MHVFYFTLFIHINFTASFLAEILCRCYVGVNCPGLGSEVEENDENPSFHRSY